MKSDAELRALLRKARGQATEARTEFWWGVGDSGNQLSLHVVGDQTKINRVFEGLKVNRTVSLPAVIQAIGQVEPPEGLFKSSGTVVLTRAEQREEGHAIFHFERSVVTSAL